MKRKSLRLLALMMTLALAVSLLAACADPGASNSNTTNTPDTPDVPDVPDTPGEPSLADYLGKREDVEEVLINRWEMGLVPTTEDEANALLDAVYGVDLTKFIQTNEPAVVAWSRFDCCLTIGRELLTLRFETRGEGSPVCAAIVKDFKNTIDDMGNPLMSSGETIYFNAPADIISIAELSELQESILHNTSDKENCAIVTVDGKGELPPVRKGNTRQAVTIMDAALEHESTEKAPDGVTYNITAKVGELVYKYNSTTGHVAREAHGKTLYGKVNENWVSMCDRALTTVPTAVPDDAPTNPFEGDPRDPNITLLDFLGTREDVEAVYATMGIINMGEALIPTTEDEAKMLLDAIYSADLTEFENADDISGRMKNSFAVKVDGKIVEFDVELSLEDDSVIVTVFKESPGTVVVGDRTFKRANTRYYYIGPAGSIDVAGLSNAHTVIRTNNTDMENCAVVKSESDGTELSLNKASTWIFRRVADVALEETGSATAPEGVEYDVTVLVGEDMYRICTETGYFLREMDGDTLYGVMNEFRLDYAYMNLGLLNLLGIPGT